VDNPAKANPEVVLAVWAAEDGRCEACTRAMDKRWARVTRLNPAGDYTVDNLQLLCVDCAARRPDPLAAGRIVLGESVVKQVLGQLTPEQLGPATTWLGLQLKRYRVIVRASKRGRSYWLPGVGTFSVTVSTAGPVVVERVERLAALPAVKVKPQERTRGFPRPDRRPVQPKRTAGQQAPLDPKA
jgi:hypothetical protein